ncbi:transmembrane protein DUF3566 [Flavimobilis soli]|uniref:Transmembrane protein DUF3566 n=1 Tax=Flavimobilis soli TaxID=442709 RepID=A0A2A9EDA4_9MICO|nr:DUF3566 domain-containing protein [Flavimobilis soli]PFG36894.1 transmembrane protein DUF3566 [Flavimobilis soli]
MTEKDKKGAGAPPAIAPRKRVPRPTTDKAKATNPVPAPPSDDTASASSVETSGTTSSPAEAAPASVPSAPEATAPDAASTTSSDAEASAADASQPAWQPSAASAEPAVDPEASAVAAGPRKVRLSLSRVDPWSVMKLSFLLSVAAGIMLIVAAWVFWYAVNSMGVFTQIDEMVRDIVGSESTLDVLQYVERDKVLSIATLIAVVDVVLLTALGTIGAFLYNVTAALVGGLHVTLTDE